jgi:hypothetical protein
MIVPHHRTPHFPYHSKLVDIMYVDVYKIWTYIDVHKLLHFKKNKKRRVLLVGGRLFALVEDFGVFVVVFTFEERF